MCIKRKKLPHFEDVKLMKSHKGRAYVDDLRVRVLRPSYGSGWCEGCEMILVNPEFAKKRDKYLDDCDENKGLFFTDDRDKSGFESKFVFLDDDAIIKILETPFDIKMTDYMTVGELRNFLDTVYVTTIEWEGLAEQKKIVINTCDTELAHKIQSIVNEHIDMERRRFIFKEPND